MACLQEYELPRINRLVTKAGKYILKGFFSIKTGLITFAAFEAAPAIVSSEPNTLHSIAKIELFHWSSLMGKKLLAIAIAGDRRNMIEFYFVFDL